MTKRLNRRGFLAGAGAGAAAFPAAESTSSQLGLPRQVAATGYRNFDARQARTTRTADYILQEKNQLM